MKYRKKPIVIEACQTDKEVIIETLEGDMKANIGDYIITGVNGEKYHCKSEIFEKTYEQADKQPELSTAEMLLWLAENESIDIWHTATESKIYVWRNGNAITVRGKTLTEAINAAYDWAKD